MDSSDDFKDSFRRELNNLVHIKNQELCQELGKLKEKTHNLEISLQNAKLEISNRDCLIDKVIRENETLEEKLKCKVEMSSSFQQICREKESLKKELDCCQSALAQLQKKYECLENQKETDKIKSGSNAIEKIGEELENIRRDKEKQLVESEDRIYELRQELEALNEEYLSVCFDLKEKTTELNHLRQKHECYKQEVGVIREYAIKVKEEAGVVCHHKVENIKNCRLSDKNICAGKDSPRQNNCLRKIDHGRPPRCCEPMTIRDQMCPNEQTYNYCSILPQNITNNVGNIEEILNKLNRTVGSVGYTNDSPSQKSGPCETIDVYTISVTDSKTIGRSRDTGTSHPYSNPRDRSKTKRKMRSHSLRSSKKICLDQRIDNRSQSRRNAVVKINEKYGNVRHSSTPLSKYACYSAVIPNIFPRAKLWDSKKSKNLITLFQSRNWTVSEVSHQLNSRCNQ